MLLNILILGFFPTSFKQIINKFEYQASKFKRYSTQIYSYILGKKTNNFDFSDLHTNFIQCDSIEEQIIAADKIINHINPDIVYIRYQGIALVTEPFIALANKYNNFVFESQTKKPEELLAEKSYEHLKLEIKNGPRLLKSALGIAGITEEIVNYELDRCKQPNKPALVMGNGINVENVPIKKFPKAFSPINLIQIANFDVWKGTDRILYGLKNYGSDDIKLYCIGSGSQYNLYKEIAKNLGLDSQVIFTGWLERKQVEPIINKAHIGIANIGLHRKSIREASNLKVREYISRGLPFVKSHPDPDIPSNFPYSLTIPANDDPVSINSIKDFASDLYSGNDFREHLRTFASENKVVQIF